MKMVRVAPYFWGACETVVIQALKDWNALICSQPLQNLEESHGTHFHHDRQARLIHYFDEDQTPLLTYVT